MESIESFSPNSVTLTQLVDGINTTDIHNLENLLKSYKDLVDANTTLLNEIGTTPTALATLESEKASLVTTLATVIQTKTELATQKTALMQQEVTIGTKRANLETWIANNPFKEFNIDSKIGSIVVFGKDSYNYTGGWNSGIAGIQINYVNPTKQQVNLGVTQTSQYEYNSSTGNYTYGYSVTINFESDEYLIQIKITESDRDLVVDSTAEGTQSTANTNNFICKSISVFTNKSPSKPKDVIPWGARSNNETVIKPSEQIINFTINPLQATYDFIYSLDIQQRTNANAISADIASVIVQVKDSYTSLTTSIDKLDTIITSITANIKFLDDKKIMIDKLNANGSIFSSKVNANSAMNTQRINTRLGFTNLLSEPMSIMEGNTNMGNFVNANNTGTSVGGVLINNLITDVHSLENKQTSGAISEFVIKKDNIFSNVLTDYMINNAKEDNVERVYNDINQKNSDKMRNIEINTYYDKAYKEYINILKVIILACIILVPIVIANKNSLLPDSITNILVLTIITLTIIYIIYKFYDIYMRDNRDFDKIRIPYDKEAVAMQESGTLTKKNNLFSTITCIGEDCCPTSSTGMVYDPVKNICVLKEKFSNYTDGSLDGTLSGYIDDSINGLLGGSNQTGKFSLVEPYVTKEQMSGRSLNNSSETSFNNNM